MRSLNGCVARCVLYSVREQVVLWIEGTWPTRVQAAHRAFAALAVQGLPCSSGTASESQAPLWLAFVSLQAIPGHSFRL